MPHEMLNRSRSSCLDVFGYFIPVCPLNTFLLSLKQKMDRGGSGLELREKVRLLNVT